MGNFMNKGGGPQKSMKGGNLRDGVMRGTVENLGVKYGVAWSQGFRPTMEDRHQVFASLPADQNTAYFAVFDGHGGVRCAEFLSQELHTHVSRGMDAHKGDIDTALKEGFVACDEEFVRLASENHMLDGATCNVLLLNKEEYICANAGDTRAVLCRKGTPIALSRDHKPKDPDEAKRIKEAGGFVALGRVQGQLAVSRAFGDYQYKQRDISKKGAADNKNYIVVAEPEIMKEQRQPGDEFVVIACDGLWDVMSNLQVTDIIRKALAEKKDPQAIARSLVESAVLSLKSMDNVSVMIVLLDGNNS